MEAVMQQSGEARASKNECACVYVCVCARVYLGLGVRGGWGGNNHGKNIPCFVVLGMGRRSASPSFFKRPPCHQAEDRACFLVTQRVIWTPLSHLRA